MTYMHEKYIFVFHLNIYDFFCSNHEFVTLWSGASLKMTKKWHILAPTVKCYEFVIKKKLFPPEGGGEKKNHFYPHWGYKKTYEHG